MGFIYKQDGENVIDNHIIGFGLRCVIQLKLIVE